MGIFSKAIGTGAAAEAREGEAVVEAKTSLISACLSASLSIDACLALPTTTVSECSSAVSVRGLKGTEAATCTCCSGV